MYPGALPSTGRVPVLITLNGRDLSEPSDAAMFTYYDARAAAVHLVRLKNESIEHDQKLHSFHGRDMHVSHLFHQATLSLFH